MNKGKIGNKYCLGGNSERNNKNVVEDICNILDQNYPKEKSYKNLIEFVLDRPGHDRRYAIDSTKVERELKWVPKLDVKESINLTDEWYKKFFFEKKRIKDFTLKQIKEYIKLLD